MKRSYLLIFKAFQSADKTISTLSTKFPICSEDKLTSKLLNFKNLPKQVNSSSISPAKLSKTF
ncbi:12528_t:CDS:1, partial [Gigaspora rosea]